MFFYKVKVGGPLGQFEQKTRCGQKPIFIPNYYI